MTAVIDPEAWKRLEILRRAVAEALDRKRRLGHYAVFWRERKVVGVPPEELPKLEDTPAKVPARDDREGHDG